MVLGPGTSGHSIKEQGSRIKEHGPGVTNTLPGLGNQLGANPTEHHKCDIYATLYR